MEKNIEELVKNSPRKDNLVVFKVEPVPRFCCCSHCVRDFWETINNEIYPQGPIEHEGSAVLNIQNEQIVLEQHESGPELIAFLNSVTAICNFIKLLFSLSIDAFTKKGATKIKITKKIITTKQKLVNEAVFEIESSKSPEEIIKAVNKILTGNRVKNKFPL
jgi:hypothetical protein